MDRKVFYASVRGNPLGRTLTQQQVDGIEAILDEWDERWSGRDPRCLAYILATVFHETDGSFQPVREGSVGGRRLTDAQARAYVAGRGYPYAKPIRGKVYYGRGLVQLTWIENYRKIGLALGLDLVGNPELACDPSVAVRILFEGMFRGRTGRGDFTGKALEDYFGGPRGDLATAERAKAREARRIVNGSDRADLVAGYFVAFMRALDAAAAPAPATLATEAPGDDAGPAVDAGQPVGQSKIVWSSVGAAAAAGAPAVFGINNPWAFAALGTVAVTLLILVALLRKELAYRTGV